MELFIEEHAILALFVLSFLASTLLPLGSEWLLILLLTRNHDPAGLVLVAAVGNTLGACTTYLVGFFGSDWLVEKLLRVDREKQHRAEKTYARYGAWSLLFSWVPVVGDPLCLVGGLLKVGFARYVLLVASGKFIRYAVVAWLTLKAVA